MKYIIDTDTLIYFLKGREAIVKRLAAIPENGIYTTIITQAELLFGAYHSAQKSTNLYRIESLLETLQILPFCEKSAYVFAEHKALLRAGGNLLDDMDLMIGSIALQNRMILVTNNTRHFNRIEGLKLENWV